MPGEVAEIGPSSNEHSHNGFLFGCPLQLSSLGAQALQVFGRLERLSSGSRRRGYNPSILQCRIDCPCGSLLTVARPTGLTQSRSAI